MTAQVIRPNFRPAPIRCLDASPVRAHAEALMRLLVKDKRIPRERLHLLADVLDPMLATMESDDG